MPRRVEGIEGIPPARRIELWVGGSYVEGDRAAISRLQQMRSGDDIDFNADGQLRDTKPNRYVRLFNFGTSTQAGWNCGGMRQYLRFSGNFSATLHNFMRVSAGATRIVASQSDDLTRGGPLIGTANAQQFSAQLNSRANVPTTWTARATYYEDAPQATTSSSPKSATGLA